MNYRILVAPLNWGLGHATRCIPVIRALQENGFSPVIASDGIALELLKKEFPGVESIYLPSYQIEYAREGKYFKLKMIWDSPKMIKAIRREKRLIKKIVKERQIDGIISDNRLGVYHKKIPSVFITHQLNVLTGSTSWLSSKVHRKFIRKFDQCWIPDAEGKPNLSGKLGHLKKENIPVKYIGPLSRLQKKELEIVYDLAIILSGPEPQRTLLENKILKEIQNYHGTILFVRGEIENTQNIQKKGNTTIYNFMRSEELETALNQSALVLSRSGYTTIMDLVNLRKKAFFIPTPGQYEQEYLAKRLKKNGMLPYVPQKDFRIQMLSEVENYEGLPEIPVNRFNFEELFEVFRAPQESPEVL
ncbi:glycosyltransferase [Sinomicrobium weinanense]|uniref:Glycosyltransferase n=1 Tax=Sinomicrobium weinanense TaxID=2842200 RepID=A0A926JTT6_9FLAO|nr:glycosyltransferase [Sinomicrobium weinanense]MBC9797415.1 glycosyltransferase [Sinomicrobium weinanense]MBU3123091.1 glycosyltransferase [Sinomicrobium weinanense]